MTMEIFEGIIVLTVIYDCRAWALNPWLKEITRGAGNEALELEIIGSE